MEHPIRREAIPSMHSENPPIAEAYHDGAVLVELDRGHRPKPQPRQPARQPRRFS
jgi:hypothetical protein